MQTLVAVLRWNAAYEIPLFRITSELIPLATHPVAEGWDWAADLADEFAACAALARETGPEAGLVLHIGGGYGDKAAAGRRFVTHFGQLPPAVADRLWLENDDTTWETPEVLALAAEVGRPMVLDIHHHRVLREDDWRPWLDRILPTWGGVRPKVHFSSPRDGERSRSHADGIDAADFARFLVKTEGLDLDVMLECKLKDQALLALRRSVRR